MRADLQPSQKFFWTVNGTRFSIVMKIIIPHFKMLRKLQKMLFFSVLDLDLKKKNHSS